MRLKFVVLGSTALVSFGTSAAVVAQVTAAAPVQPAAATADPAPDDAIIVTGLRRSIQSAQAIKQNSVQIIDSVVAEDIGKLPDVAVSDTAARIVGVQVERGGGEAGRVLVRGLPNFTTTYNGREIFTAEARSVALQDFPAGAIAALEVFKTTTADLVEGGLAGEVNVRSRKPFDFDGFHIAGSAWAQYAQRSGKVDPNGNLLVTDRFDTGIGEIGVLVNVSYTELHYLDSTRSNTDFVADPPIGAGGARLLFPDIQRVTYGQGDRQRPSVNGALQWKASDRLTIYGEALWQGFRNAVSDRETSVPLYGAQSYSNIVIGPSNVVQSLTAVNPRRPESFQGATLGTTDTYQYAIGGSYDAGPLKITADVARTASKFTDSIYSFDTNYAAPVTVNAVVNSAVGPSFSYVNGPNVGAASTYIFRGFFDRQLIARGADVQARVDLTYDTSIEFAPKIMIGGRYVDRDASFEDGSRYSYQEPNGVPLSAVPVTLVNGQSGFPSNDPQFLRTYLTPSYSSIRGNVAQLRSLVGFAAGPPPADPTVTYQANEKSYAGYIQTNYAFGSDTGIRIDGALGVRGVATSLNIGGTSRVGNALSPIAVGKEYTDWLPNISARVRFTDKLQLRLSATKTRTRPDFSQYNPGLIVDPTSTVGTRFANGGNPNLNPLKSDNYDASLEYYYSKAGSASVAVFRRDLNGFIQNYQTDVVDPTYGAIRITRPYNSGAGRIDGAEAQVTAFADFAGLPAWARGFGVVANVTYLDAKTGFPTAFGGPTAGQQPIIGVSKWTYNADLIYEYAGFSARLSYNLRNGFASSSGYNNGFRNYTESTQAISRLDVSASYDVFKYLTITADATNILGRPLRVTEQTIFANTYPTVVLPRSVRYEESVYSLGVRFRY